MTARQVKVALLNFLLYEQRRMMAMTEFRFADVFAVTQSFYTEEIEVKVEKGDLQSELQVVSWAAGFGDHKAFPWNKKNKHERYIRAAKTGRTEWQHTYSEDDVPNRFYFAVTADLKELAERGIRDTPYGLIIITDPQVVQGEYRTPLRVEMIKKATNLHSNKVLPEKMAPYLRKVCIENHSLMEKAEK